MDANPLARKAGLKSSRVSKARKKWMASLRANITKLDLMIAETEVMLDELKTERLVNLRKLDVA